MSIKTIYVILIAFFGLMQKEKNINGKCIRCGTCCRKGGPVLHQEDKTIIIKGYVGHHHLVTIRKGEIALNPINNKLEPVEHELVKVKGKGKDWLCYFYNEKDSSCKIYEHRFLECRLLKCWDTSDILSIIGKNTLIREDIINKDDPILEVIKMHERECSYMIIEELISKILNNKKEHINILNKILIKDMKIRNYAIDELGMDKKYEHFIFGRPIIENLNLRKISF